MSKYYKFLVSIVCIVLIASTSVLFADSKIRRVLIDELGCGMVVNFLDDLYSNNMSDFMLLFNYVEYNKGILSYNFATDLREKKLTGINDAPSERLALTFKLLKQIFDDYNKEKKAKCYEACCKACCGGCFVSWGRENGMRQLKFTPNNAGTLIVAISNKGSIHKSQEIVASCVESVLARLATNQND